MSYRPLLLIAVVALVAVLAAVVLVSSEPDEAAWIEARSLRNRALALIEEAKDRPAALNEAQDAFRRVAEILPREPLGYVGVGYCLRRNRKFDEAVEWFGKAVAADGAYAPSYALKGEALVNRSPAPGETREQSDALRQAGLEDLRRAIELDPSGVRSRWELARYHLTFRSPESLQQAATVLKDLLDVTPDNLAARMSYAQALAETGAYGPAAEIVRNVLQWTGELKDEEKGYLTQALEQLTGPDPQEGLIPLITAHNVLRTNPLYALNMDQYKTMVEGDGRGMPPLPPRLFRGETLGGSWDGDAELGPLVLEHSALIGSDQPPPDGPGRLALADVDGDGTPEVVVLLDRENAGLTWHKLDLREGRSRAAAYDLGPGNVRYTDLTAFDWECDGDTDVVALGRDGSLVVLLNQRLEVTRPGAYQFQTGQYERDAVVEHPEGIRFEPLSLDVPVRAGGRLLPLDYDIDGDLDVLVVPPADAEDGPVLVRNHRDYQVSDQTAGSGFADLSGVQHACRADLDGDGDIDVLLTKGEQAVGWHDNLRLGRYRDRPLQVLAARKGARRTVAGDLDNDGELDLVVATTAGIEVLLGGDGGPLSGAGSALRKFPAEHPGDRALVLCDLDEDGDLDLVAVDGQGRAVLYTNTGDGNLAAGRPLAADLADVEDLVFADWSGDGRPDMAVLRTGGKLEVYRNPGVPGHRSITVQLIGTPGDAGKNNRDGIDARVEIRAGSLYQMRYASGPRVHFGLGTHDKVDQIRVAWLNGSVQSTGERSAGTEPVVLEQKYLLSSCPFLYAWDGERFVMVTDCLGGSPLGLRVDDEHYAFIDLDEYVHIPRELLQPRDGKLELRYTEELWEAVYLDRVALVAADHPAGTEVAAVEGLRPPPFPDGSIHALADVRAPRQARACNDLARAQDDGSWADVTAQVAATDGLYTHHFRPTHYQGLAEPHSLEIDFGSVPATAHARLLLTGWIYWTDTNINVAVDQDSRVQWIPPRLEVADGDGWRTVTDFMAFPPGKTKTIAVDLGTLPQRDHVRLRITTSLQLHWDRIALAVDAEDAPVQLTRVDPESAELRFRGYSRMSPRGPFSPHMFDYADVVTDPLWPTMEGMYTRYGDVRELLLAEDDRYVIFPGGDEVALAFNERAFGPLRAGWVRDWFLYSTGWDKDANLNTAYGQTVDPLPFKGMSAYPYGPDEAYPDDPEHRAYIVEYNTRRLGPEAWRAWLRDRAARPGKP